MISYAEIYAFCIAIFIALLFTSPGLYLSDELAPANQLYQISQGHQLVYHEEKYGTYENGTRDKSIVGSHGIMIYPLLIPIISLPIYIIISLVPDTSRILPLIFCSFILLIAINTAQIFHKNNLHYKKYFYMIACAFIVTNILYYSRISQNLEIVAIVLTNVILYGIFGVYIWKFISYLFEENIYQNTFVWIAVMASSSLLFWVSVLKDHLIISLLFIMVLYYIIQFYNLDGNKNLIFISILTGIIIWERPELSIVIAPLVCLLIIYKFKQLCLTPLVIYSVALSFSMIPAVLNNYIVTGSLFKFPYQAVGQTLGGFHLTSSSNVFNLLIYEIPSHILSTFSTISLNNIIGISIYPINGGVGLLTFTIITVFALILLPYFIFTKKIEIDSSEIILYLFSFATFMMYLFTTAIGFTLHAETGILPDMRYFTLIYAPLMIASLSLFNKMFININYKSLIRKFVIWFGILLIGFTISVVVLSNGIMTMQSINMTANLITLIIFAISIAIMIDTIRTNRVDGLETNLAIMISLPLTWQIFSSIFAVKVYSSPMILPIIDIIKKLIIG